jgi:hypothetical protein
MFRITIGPDYCFKGVGVLLMPNRFGNSNDCPIDLRSAHFASFA